MTMKRITCLCLALLLVPTLALAQPAQPKTAADWFKEGETHYNLCNFSDAIEAFKKAFALETVQSNKAVYLYNIAQSYRFGKDCSNAQFFYKRFLALNPPLSPAKRGEIEARIKELEDCARQQEAIKNRPPDTNLKPDGSDGDGTTPDEAGKGPGKGTEVAEKRDPDEGGEDDPDEGLGVQKPAGQPPRVVSVRLTGGGSKLSAGDLPIPVQATGALIGGYPIPMDNVVLEVGGGFTFTPVPFAGPMMESKTAQLIGVMANVGLTYLAHPRVGVRGDLGVGARWFNGVGESPFTDFAPTSGALPMFHLRIGLSADFAITPNVVATVVPIAFSYSPPPSGLRDDIKSITALDFMVGLGYRM
jgi:tetratricopeptide (TPR) repeat protein